MKNCINCKYSIWDKTKDGKLHPSGNGRCTFHIKMPQLPVSMYWIGGEPSPYGGSISREEEFKKDCACFVMIKAERKP